MIVFLLNNQRIEIPEADGNQTVLDYLRANPARRGSKEGCASGDCGACTAVVASPNDGRLHYRTINTCITLLGNLHGQQLITVEDLANAQQLHPVQRAMVDKHGAQCGFCTPGFVMSMFALFKQGEPVSHQDVEVALGGNLCRCTGYRPIVDAALEACAQGPGDHFSPQEAHTLAALEAIQSSGEWQNSDSRFFQPRSLPALSQHLLDHPEARLVAGSTDLALEITQMHRQLPHLVSTTAVPELQRLEADDHYHYIGAAVSYQRAHQPLSDDYPDLAPLFHRLGSQQIRNTGTLGGNIGNASPIGDSPPPLIALGAKLLLQQGESTRSVALEDFYLDYKKTVLNAGEFIREIQVPRAQANAPFRVYKISKRIDDDISAVCGAFYLKQDYGVIAECRVAFGGMAAIPKRASHCEAALLGQPLTDATIQAAQNALAQDFQPIDDVRASRHYRLKSAQNLLKRLQLELTQPQTPTRVNQHVHSL